MDFEFEKGGSGFFIMRSDVFVLRRDDLKTVMTVRAVSGIAKMNIFSFEQVYSQVEKIYFQRHSLV
jgi:hypothetical protein